MSYWTKEISEKNMTKPMTKSMKEEIIILARQIESLSVLSRIDWERLSKKAKKALTKEIRNTTLEGILGDNSNHPLRYNAGLLTGTTWEKDETTFTNIITYMLSEYYPLRGLLAWELFGRLIFPDLKKSYFLRKIKDNPGAMIALTQHRGEQDRNQKSKKWRRADIQVIFKMFEDDHRSVLIEAKIGYKFDPNQLNDTRRQLLPSKKFKYTAALLLSFHEEPKRAFTKRISKGSEYKGLSKVNGCRGWQHWHWSNILIAIEKVHYEARRSGEISSSIKEWTSFALAALWRLAEDTFQSGRIICPFSMLESGVFLSVARGVKI